MFNLLLAAPLIIALAILTAYTIGRDVEASKSTIRKSQATKRRTL